jgi:murein DD-endopeptidase MepM/ murein hydrolase activator NlpD
MKRTFLTLAALALITTITANASAPQRRTTHTTRPAAETSGVKNVFWQPNDLQQGSPAFFTVELDRAPTRVTATWVSKTLTFFKTTDPKVWYALAGDDLETQPGSYDLAVTATLPNGHVARSIKKIDIAPANFLTGSVDVPENFVEPDAASRKQIASDGIAKAHAFAHLIPAPQWSGNFKQPVIGKSTPSFGESRILNEEKESLHRGTDFPVNEGTLVEASNAGTVVLAKDLFYEGGCIIIDHGQRLFTLYMHLSKINVNAGDRVEKGAHIGLSGATGRVTGPHLHFGVRWNGANLDPVKFTALTLPTIPANDRTTRKPTPHTATHHH